MSAPDDGLMRIGKRCYVSNLAWRTSWQVISARLTHKRFWQLSVGHHDRCCCRAGTLTGLTLLGSYCVQDLKDKFRDCGTVVYANVTRGDDGKPVLH